MDTAVAAVVQDGVVTNRIVVEIDDSRATTFVIDGAEVTVLPDDSPVDIGWLKDGANFVNPPPAEE